MELYCAVCVYVCSVTDTYVGVLSRIVVMLLKFAIVKRSLLLAVVDTRFGKMMNFCKHVCYSVHQ